MLPILPQYRIDVPSTDIVLNRDMFISYRANGRLIAEFRSHIKEWCKENMEAPVALVRDVELRGGSRIVIWWIRFGSVKDRVKFQLVHL